MQVGKRDLLSCAANDTFKIALNRSDEVKDIICCTSKLVRPRALSSWSISADEIRKGTCGLFTVFVYLLSYRYLYLNTLLGSNFRLEAFIIPQ